MNCYSDELKYLPPSGALHCPTKLSACACCHFSFLGSLRPRNLESLKKIIITVWWIKTPVFVYQTFGPCGTFLAVILADTAGLTFWTPLPFSVKPSELQSTQQLYSTTQKWSPTAVMHTCLTTAVQRKATRKPLWAAKQPRFHAHT